MGRRKRLDETKKRLIEMLEAENVSVAEIARKLKRSRHVVSSFLQNKENYGKKKSPGRPRAVTKRERRAILRVASNSTLTARQIAAEANVNTNVKNVRRILQQAKHLKRLKLKKKPPLTHRHKQQRREFAEEHGRWKNRWRKVMFTDEKKINLDGPDGFTYYFHDLRKDTKTLSRRQMGGGSVMIWAGIGYRGKTDIQFISGRLSSEKYIQLIDEPIQRHATQICEENFIFQQDNAPVHASRATREYLDRKHIAVMDWPPRSPDLNIIENCWGNLSRAVYANAQQFQTVQQLKDRIVQEWDAMDQNYIQNLYNSLPKRMLEVISKQGGFTHY